MAETNRKAASSYLGLGENSIDRNTCTEHTKNGKRFYMLRWNVRTMDGVLVAKRSQGPTMAVTRARAKTAAENVLRMSGADHGWQPNRPIEVFIDEVTIPAITDSELTANTKRRYLGLVKLIRAQLKGRPIVAAIQFDVLKAMIHAIGMAHGKQNARQSRIVTNKYITQELIARRLISHNPLLGVQLSAKDYPRISTSPERGGVALTSDEQEAVITHLLNLDPTQGVAPDKKHGHHYATRLVRRKQVIAITLLQAGTGMRISEALALMKHAFAEDGHSQLHIVANRTIVKGKRKGRHIGIFDERIELYLRSYIADLKLGDRLFHVPSKPGYPWALSGSSGAAPFVAQLYQEMAQELDIPALTHNRSHLWRTTLSTRLKEVGVSVERISEVLGHNVKTNQEFYTEVANVAAMQQIYRGHASPDQAGPSS